jgi:hypothetical protein
VFFTAEAIGLRDLPAALRLPPENNTLFLAALRTISGLLDNRISLVR